MDNQTKVIFGLIALVAILAGIFILKATGVIKPLEKNIEKNETTKIEKNFNKKSNKYETKMNLKYSLNKFFFKHPTLVAIVFYIVVIVVSIGIGKLYKKLSMPEWTSIYQYLYPFIMLASTFLPGLLQTIVNVILNITEIYILSYYFESIGMSRYWPMGTIIVFLMVQFGNVVSWFSNSFNGSNIVGEKFWTIIGIIVIVAFIVAYIIANIRVADKLKKNNAFKVGMAILPFIFQPILGFMTE